MRGMNKANQQVPPVPNEPSVKASKNLNFAKALAYGFVVVSVGISIAVGGYLLLNKEKTTQPVSYDESPESFTKKTDLINLPDAMRLKGSAGEVKTIMNSPSANLKPSGKSMIPVAFAQEQANPMRLLFYLEYAGKGNNPDNPHSYNLFSYNLITQEKTKLTELPLDAPIDFSSSELGYIVYNSINSLHRINIKTGEVTKISSNYQGPFPPSISPDGKKLALIKNSTQVAILDLESLTEGKPNALPNNTSGSNSILWSPLGDSIYVTVAPRDATFTLTHIVEINLESGEVKTVLTTDTLKDALSFEPYKDIKKLLFIENPTTENASFVEHNLSTGESRTIQTDSQLSFTGYVMDPASSTIYYTRSDKGLIAMGLGGKQSTLITQIQSTPYLRLIGFGTNVDELILNGLATGKDGVQRDFYYLYTISKNSWINLLESGALPQKGM